MKVLMYCWEFPPHISGGLGVACHGIVNGLLANNQEILLVLPRASTMDATIPESVGLQVLESKQSYSNLNPYHNHAVRLKLGGVVNTYGPKTYGQDTLTAVKQYAAEVSVFAATHAHDVIHAHDWLTILAGVEAKKLSKKPLVFQIHALEIDRSAIPLNKTIFEIEKYGMQQADAIIAVSHYTKKRVCDYYQISENKVHVAHNGIFKEQLNKQQPKKCSNSKYKTVLFLGRVTYQKAPLHFIQAAHKILAHRTDIQFVIAGDGDLLHSSIEKVAELGLGTHIHFTKFINKEECQRIFDMSQLYVMPSISEPFGLSCLEALANNVPVIISKQSGVSEVIKSALKIDFWDIDKMASHICALIDYPALALQLVENSSGELQQLLWDKSAKEIYNVYKSLSGT